MTCYVGSNEVMDKSNIIISDSALFRFGPCPLAISIFFFTGEPKAALASGATSEIQINEQCK